MDREWQSRSIKHERVFGKIDNVGHVTCNLGITAIANNSGNACALLVGGFGIGLGIEVAGASASRSGIWACRSKNTQV